MKLCIAPKVYLIGRQTVDQAEIDRFLSDEGVSWSTDTDVAAEVLVETAGRVCYMSYAKPRPGGNKAYIDHIKEVGHGSVCEHAIFNVLVTGVSRSLSHELVRHRAGMSPSQLSQRYVDESVAEYVVPPDLRLEVDAHLYMMAVSRQGDAPPAMTEAEADAKWPAVAKLATESLDAYFEACEAGKAWVSAVEHSHKKYVELSDYLTKKAAKPVPCGDCKGAGGHTRPGRISGSVWSLCRTCEGKLVVPLFSDKTSRRKYARQAARSVLPNATETKLVLTINGRAARHILEMRCSRHADPEIRVLAHELWKVLVKESPNLFGDYREVVLPDGTVELETDFRKV